MDHMEAFTECWQRDAPRLLAYARRHAAGDDAGDVVAETFTIAWRRWAEVPDPAIGWLLRTALGVMRNRSRSTRRRDGLTARVALLQQVAAPVADTADAVVHRDEALRRLASLSAEQREALLLVTWDGLTPDEAAHVLGLRPATFRKRVSRARELLSRDEPPPRPSHNPSSPTPTPSLLKGIS
jgi:RNA polymerase sigma factor (sigma-70 family)